MMNWCSKHQLFEICPECMRELQESSPLRSTLAERHPPKIIFESNHGTPPDPRIAHETGENHE